MTNEQPLCIRPASINDRDRVSALLRKSYPLLLRGAYEESILRAALPAMTVAQPALLESGSYFVAETEAHDIVGCGGWTRERPGSGEISAGVGHIRHFGVHPAWTRQGVGRAIYRRCREDAASAGVTKLECYSTINGESFYASLGFRRVEEILVAMPNGVEFPSIHMVATI